MVETNSEPSKEGVLESISVAVIQFPFIPAIIHPESNWLSEPDGGINFWSVGQDIRQVSPLSSMPIIEPYKSRIEDYLSSEYQEWLVWTVHEILDTVIKKNPKIILFPEYSLPLEINDSLCNLLKKYSDNICIVAGIGSICRGVNEEKKNRFVIANNRELFYGEKVVPNDIERKLGIVGGKGPLIHDVYLGKKENKKMNIEILMCSDFIDNASGGETQIQIAEELNRREINPNEIDAYLVPAFSTTTDDMEHAKEYATRKHKIVAIANCSFFGRSSIWFPPIKSGASKTPFTIKTEKGESACIIADVPTKFLGKPGPTPVGITADMPTTICGKYPLIFQREEKEGKSGFVLGPQSFLSLIARRLNAAITLSGIAFARSPTTIDLTKYVIEPSQQWKELQNSINMFTDNSMYSYTSITDADIITFQEVMGKEKINLYMLMLDMLKTYLPEGAFKTKVKEIKDYIKDNDIVLPPPTLWR